MDSRKRKHSPAWTPDIIQKRVKGMPCLVVACSDKDGRDPALWEEVKSRRFVPTLPSPGFHVHSATGRLRVESLRITASMLREAVLTHFPFAMLDRPPTPTERHLIIRLCGFDQLTPPDLLVVRVCSYYHTHTNVRGTVEQLVDERVVLPALRDEFDEIIRARYILDKMLIGSPYTAVITRYIDEDGDTDDASYTRDTGLFVRASSISDDMLYIHQHGRHWLPYSQGPCQCLPINLYEEYSHHIQMMTLLKGLRVGTATPESDKCFQPERDEPLHKFASHKLFDRNVFRVMMTFLKLKQLPCPAHGDTDQ